MSENKHNINLFFDEFDARTEAAPDIIAETSTESFKRNFRLKSYNGQKWKSYQSKPEPVIGSLLVRSGKLVNTIRPAIVSDTLVRISAGSTRVPYAKIHNEGGFIRKKFGVRSYTHPNLFGKGPQQVKAHTKNVNTQMPKRQYMGINSGLKSRIKDRVGNYIKFGKK